MFKTQYLLWFVIIVRLTLMMGIMMMVDGCNQGDGDGWEW